MIPMMGKAISALLVIGLALPALAEEGEAKDVSAAKAFYKQLDYETASAHFEELALDPRLSRQEQATMLIWAAMSYAGMGEPADAERAVRRALQVDRNVELPQMAQPTVQDLYAIARSDLPPDKAAPPPPAEKPSEAPPLAPDVEGEPDLGSDEAAGEPASNDWIFYLSGGGASVLGVAAGAGAGAMALIAMETMSVRDDEAAVQLDVVDAQERANAQLGVAYGLAGLGAVAVAAGGGLIAMPLMAGE
jgi:tetratricopeptide (TPR) repeat protein